MSLWNMIWDGLWGTLSATIFSITILTLFFISGIIAIFPSKRAWVVSKAPSLLTTIGLFGTFCGVAVGLGQAELA